MANVEAKERMAQSNPAHHDQTLSVRPTIKSNYATDQPMKGEIQWK